MGEGEEEQEGKERRKRKGLVRYEEEGGWEKRRDVLLLRGHSALYPSFPKTQAKVMMEKES